MRGDTYAFESFALQSDSEGINASSALLTLHTASLSDMWARIADLTGPPFVHLTDAMTQPDTTSLATLCEDMVRGNHLAAIARIRHADGSLSRAVHRIESVRYLVCPPGSLILRREVLRDLAARWAERPFDDYWCFDLVNSLTRFTCLHASALTIAVSARMAPAIRSDRMPFSRANPLPHAQTAPLILVYGPIEASTSLYLDGLPPDLRSHLRFLRPGDLFSDLVWLAGASLVLVTRGFAHVVTSGAADLLDEIGTPYLWFVDDDFVALAGEEPLLEHYSVESVRAFVARTAGVVVTSSHLADALRSKLGPALRRLVLWPCVFDADLAAGAMSPPLREVPFRLGAFGGRFRRTSMARDIMPEIEDLLVDGRLELFITRALAPKKTLRGMHLIEFESEFRSFVLGWQRLGLDAVVHPFGISANLPNKSMASVLVASYLGANIILGDEPAYGTLDEPQGVLRVARNPGAWRAALDHLRDPLRAAAAFRRLDAWRRRAFDPELARAPFLELTRLAVAGGRYERERRCQMAMQSSALRRHVEETKKVKSPLIRLRAKLHKKWARFRTWLRHR